jgi:DNA repair protein RecO (recombination protein O)
MYFKTKGIVLSHIKYSDTSLVTTIYTESHGRKSFMVQGVYRNKSRFPPVLFQPLTLLDLEISVAPNRELQRIKEAALHQTFHSIPFNTTKSAITLFIAEILYKTLHEEESNPTLFSFLLHAIQLFDLNESGTANFHLWFLMNYTKHLGFYPINNYSGENTCFDITNGRFYAPLLMKPGNNDIVTAEWMHKLLNLQPDNLASLEISHTIRGFLLNQLIEFYSAHMGHLGAIKSLAVLQSVFGE